jgi:hypothetical protein
MFERDNTFRQIYTDGRPMPVDSQPAYNGDTLVVETTGFEDGMWLDNVAALSRPQPKERSVSGGRVSGNLK